MAHKDWLKNITEPFREERVDISAGFYKMVGENMEQKAMSVFLGVTPRHFDINFLPSTRSMAFRKSAWEAIGGFPEGKGNSAEDTDFNYKAVQLGLKYARVKSAVVEWGMPKSLQSFSKRLRLMQSGMYAMEFGGTRLKVLRRTILRQYLVLVRYLLAGSYWFTV